jgi:hypothetical protein
VTRAYSGRWDGRGCVVDAGVGVGDPGGWLCCRPVLRRWSGARSWLPTGTTSLDLRRCPRSAQPPGAGGDRCLLLGRLSLPPMGQTLDHGDSVGGTSGILTSHSVDQGQLPGPDSHRQASLRTKINHLHGQPPLRWAHGKPQCLAWTGRQLHIPDRIPGVTRPLAARVSATDDAAPCGDRHATIVHRCTGAGSVGDDGPFRELFGRVAARDRSRLRRVGRGWRCRAW